MRESPAKLEQEVPLVTAPPSEADAQMSWLEQGLRLFRDRRFTEARGCFEKAVQGPLRNVMHTAKSHIVVCDRRMEKRDVDFETADDHYNYGVERLNSRDIASARHHLAAAVALKPDCDYMLYALAAASALSGDANAAYENLRRAIEGDPRNRNSARLDSDFAGVSHDPRFVLLFHPDRTRKV